MRPTAERVREAAFNRLVHAGLDPPLEGAAFVDVFAGTGAVGLEALSRGAARAGFIERDPAVLALLRCNVGKEGTVHARDAAAPGPAPAAYDIAWLDPPWGAGTGRAGPRRARARRLAQARRAGRRRKPA